MREYTTQEVIKIIPLDKDIREELINDFDSYDEEHKLAVAKICWPSFHKLVAVLRTKYNAQILEEITAGTRVIAKDSSLIDEIELAVEKELNERLDGKVEEQVELSSLREKLKSLSKQ